MVAVGAGSLALRERSCLYEIQLKCPDLVVSDAAVIFSELYIQRFGYFPSCHELYLISVYTLKQHA